MQDLKKIIEDAIQSHEAQVQLFPRITENDVHMAIRQVMRDNPDIFWFSHQWRYSQSEAIVHFRYTIDKKRSAKIKKQIEDVVENDFKLDYVRTLPVREQVMYVYKWIALYCNYDIHSAHNQTIYSVFVHRHSVCTGIAKAAQCLLELLGIESRLVFGKMNNSEEESRHCWLVVNIEGKWYHLDPTFALPETEHLLRQCGEEPIQGEDFLFYNYFCVDTATIKKTRTIEEEELLPKCNEHLSYSSLQNIEVTPSRNGNQASLGCILSDVGTTADIYLAHSADKHFRKRTVAKVFRNDSGHELLRKELIVMRECAGPHLLRAMDADFDKGILYMEQAIPLSELLASHYYKLTVKEFCNLLIDIASGLKELLEHGIFYRDIHLNNIYFSDTVIDGRNIYNLGDFGSCTFADKDGRFAGLTERGGVGSKWYMAPETWKDGVFDERSAVYGVGMVAYHLLNDLYPPLWLEYREKSLEFRIQSHRLPIPSKLQEERFGQLRMDFLFNSLRNNPSERYQTIDELIGAISECSESEYSNQVLVEGTEFKTAAKIAQNETFCSTCVINSSIIVSNGELDGTVVDVDSDDSCPADLVCDACADGQLNNFSSFDCASQINDFATTCGGSWNNHDDAPSDDVVDFAEPLRQRIDDFATSCAPCFPNSTAPYDDNRQKDESSETYFPCSSNGSSRISSNNTVSHAPVPQYSPSPSSQSSKGLFGKIKNLIFGKSENPSPFTSIERKPIAEKVNSSVFAPSETKRGDFMMVQVFLYKDDEERAVACKAAEVDSNAIRLNHEVDSLDLKNGDRVKVKLTMSGKGIEVEEPIQEMIWEGHYTDCQFGVFVPEDYKPSNTMGTVVLTVNGIPCVRMMFITKIVSHPKKLYAKIESKAFQKIFISYSHKDEATVKYFAKAFQAQGVDYFFDRHYLKAGDVYPLKIKEYINSADLFILCWSKNAAESDYVQLERQQALALAFPQLDMEQATLSIYPISIEPYADYPNDMKEVYNFEEI